jgi:orotate phosphoribosyltransferase
MDQGRSGAAAAAQTSVAAVAEMLVERGAVAFRTEPFFTFTSGTRSPIYVDNRRLLGHPAERRAVVGELSKLLAATPFDVVAGTATAGIPWAAWLAELHDAPMVYVRGSAKSWGHQRSIEGDAPEGSTVVVVEDLISTAGSLATTVGNLREAGHEVPGCVAIVTYGTSVAARVIEDLGITCRTLTTIDATLDAATRLGLLTADQRAIVEDWLAEKRR